MAYKLQTYQYIYKYILMKLKVHIFCLKPEICQLIKKTLAMSKYEVSCTLASQVYDQNFKSFSEKPDCIILDKDMNSSLINIIKLKFPYTPFIYLPSLETDVQEESNVKFISEPLRPSELSEALDEIFKKVKPTRNIFVVILAVVLLPAFLVIADTYSSSSGKDNELCFACHEDKDLYMERNGKKISLFVSPELYKKSVHNIVECTDCHTGYNPDETPMLRIR